MCFHLQGLCLNSLLQIIYTAECILLGQINLTTLNLGLQSNFGIAAVHLSCKYKVFEKEWWDSVLELTRNFQTLELKLPVLAKLADFTVKSVNLVQAWHLQKLIFDRGIEKMNTAWENIFSKHLKNLATSADNTLSFLSTFFLLQANASDRCLLISTRYGH